MAARGAGAAARMPVLGLPLLVADPRIPFPAQFAEAVSGATVTGPWRIENVAD